ncbi:MAG TPA: lamin tail domain-containing protein [Verrucomicrobiae bacterium]
MSITAKALLGTSTILASGLFCCSGNVLINEVMYHSPAENLLECYVELYNPDTNTVNLTGWRFTRGIQYAFPTNTATYLAPGAYLVVASDAATFANKYPGVVNFVAGWTGAMSSHLKLENAAGQTVNEVNFSNDGDWAARVLTTNYNSFGHYGWEWQAPHDGGGSSLELMNPALPNDFGHNWSSSVPAGGTPGRANSVANANIAPIITGVTHSPVIPQPTDVVTVSARLVDERTNGLSLTVYYRDASTATPPAFTAAPMFDDGAHGDGLPGDGIFAAILPAQPVGTVIEFYLLAQDLEGHTRIYPNVVPPTNSTRTANLLYQVDDGVYAGSQPLYRMIMTEMERAELYQIGAGCPGMDSDAQMNMTWITVDGAVGGGTTTQLRYNCGVRNRGHGTRSSRPNNYHVNIPGDRSWKGLTGVNLNSQNAQSQVIGSAIFRRLEVPMAESRAVQVRVNGANLMAVMGNNSFGSYAANEQYNADFVQRTFALDPYGNSYRGIRDQTLCDPSRTGLADLRWLGANYAQAGYTNAYFKQNNFLQNDWSDLIDLLAVLNTVNGYQAANYVADVQRRINVEEWIQYMAANTLLDNTETCLANGVGDDYALFRGTNDTRFLALPYDLDSVMGRGLTTNITRINIWGMTNVSVMNRFMKTPEFAPLYFKWLKNYCDTVFSPARMNPLLDQLLTGYVPQGNIDLFKAYNAAQVNYILSLVPLNLTVSDSLPHANNFPYTTSPTTALFGKGNAIRTRAILVNGAPAAWTAWTASWTTAAVALNPGLNRVLVQALDESGIEFERTYTDIWYDSGAVATVAGTVAADTTWSPTAGPYFIDGGLTIAGGATLTIQPGTIVYLNTNANLVVADGGRLLAEGTIDAPIRFTGRPGSGAPWGGITINGLGASPETRFAYTLFESNGATCIHVAGGTLSLDHSTFGTTTHQYLSLDGASFLVSGCIFPTSTAGFELVHGTGGIKVGGRGIVRDCYFGGTSGYNDIMDFTGGNRDFGQPIIQYYNNVFAGPASDDILDLDGTDAWIEGNIFMHCHRNGAPDSSSAVSGGNTGADTSEITVIGNIIYDCDNAATAKQGNFYTLINNTIVHTTKTGGEDFASGIVNVQDVGTTFGRGYYLEGNIITDAEQLVRNYDPAQTTVTFNNNLVPMAWTGPGMNNLVVVALLKHIPDLSETYFADWQSAQVMRDWFSLQPGSPARGTGPNGRDMGGVVPLGASVAGEPVGTNNLTTATLTVGVVRSGFGMPVAGFPNGSGYTHYRYRLDGGAWSGEISTTTPISLTGLANGPHRVEVSGKRDSGYYQDDPAFGADALVTSSRTWVVDTGYIPPTRTTVRLNEILALNSTTLTNAGTTPDLVELYNYGAGSVDLAGLSLSDNAALPNKFTFPAGTPLLASHQYLTLYADSQTGAPGVHLGFALKTTGDDLYLFDKAANGGALLDSVVFGVQLPDYSIGRGADGAWVLCRPTFGANNIAVLLGDAHHLKINEWLADGLFLANNDFIELFNADSLPVLVGGCYFSDAEGAPALSPIPALSFIAPTNYLPFIADSDPQQGADHLAFKLDPNVGIVILSDSTLQRIDAINYGPQTTDVSQGRSPNGSDILVSFAVPTPGAPNPVPNGVLSVTNVTSTMVNLVGIDTPWRYDNSGGTNFGTSWYQIGFNDSAWPQGLGLFGYETTPAEYPFPFRTTIPAPNQAGGKIAVYYRTHFQWDGSLTDYTLVSTNFVDDGAVYYLNGTRMSASIRMPAAVTYDTLATGQISVEGTPEYLAFTDRPVPGDNVLAVEVHQINTTSSDDVFGMQLNAVHYATNVVTSITGIPVVLNEVVASNHSLTNANGTLSDWVELFNAGPNTISLAGLGLTDDANNPRKYVFGTATALPAGGYLQLYCNNDLPAATNNSGFSLRASGGSLLLFNSPANGGGLIDGVNYGLQAADFSIGRMPDGSGGWALTVPTPKAPNLVAGLASVSNLKVNEWMADPASGPDWFEVHNSASLPVSISGLSFTDDLTKKSLSPVPPLSFIGIGPDAFVKFVADNDQPAGANHVGFALSRLGEAIGLFSPVGTLIDAVSFGAQQTGVSQGRFPDGSANIVNFAGTPSPAESNYLPVPNVVVNEVLSHTDPPLEDAVEFYNASPAAVNIGGWFLSNDPAELKKYRVPDNTMIAGYDYKVIYEYQFNSPGGSSVPFTFNSAHGDRVYLSEADAGGALTGYRAPAIFGSADNSVSFGRYTNSVGQVDFVALSSRSFGVDNPATVEQFRLGTGAPNAHPLVGPVVINEIMFYPPPNGLEDDTQDEFIELHNVSPNDVPLFDPQALTNTWKVKGGVNYTFPQGVHLPAGGFLLIVNFDPGADPLMLANFRARYNLSPAVPLFGPYAGNLANGGESIALYYPDSPQIAPHPDAGYVPYVLTDQISYLNAAPWPIGAGGTGSSLQRNVASNYGNDPANWFVAVPTAGRPNLVDPLDTNGDGLPDAWQIQYFGSITAPQAAPGADPDNDGFNNAQEFLAGTNPTLATSYLKIDSVQPGGTARNVAFTAVAGRTYTVLFKDDLNEAVWLKLADVPAQSASGPISIPDTTAANTRVRFYRLVTPQVP